MILFSGPDDAEVPLNIPKEVAIKVFKTTLNEFKNRDKYIRDDYRFRDRFSKQNPRKVGFIDFFALIFLKTLKLLGLV